MSNYGALAKIPKDEILAKLKAGMMPVQIAKELGVCKSAISERFKDDPEYLAAREYSMEVRLDEGELAIDDAGDDLNLARAREISQRRREWRAEREFPKRWGAKQDAASGISIQVVIAPHGEQVGVTIESQPVDKSIDATHQRIESD